VHGRHDPQAPWRSGAEIAATLRHSRLEIFERSGHYPHIEEPERRISKGGRPGASKP
jgi:pimeloyl-ACP methyl ester carboxylesterase